MLHRARAAPLRVRPTLRPAFAPVQPKCEVCDCRDAHVLMCCPRCQVVFYCSPAHQREDLELHHEMCHAATAAIARLREEELRLRKVPASLFFPADVFATGVGRFDHIPGTRAYLMAKQRVVKSMMLFETPTAIALALSEAMDCLRLCRADAMGIRHGIPSLLLRLGRIQECYDFIKWWATTAAAADYEWGDLARPYLDLRGAELLESVDDFDKPTVSLEHLAALTYIKIQVIHGVRELRDARKARVTETFDETKYGFLPLDALRRRNDLDALVSELYAQGAKAFIWTHRRNPHFWAVIDDPTPMFRFDLAGASPAAHGHELAEVREWMEPNLTLWYSSERSLQHIRDHIDLLEDQLARHGGAPPRV